MKIVCAWCNETLDESESGFSDKSPVSHGICPECAKKMLAPMAMPMTAFLDRFPVPVYVVDGNVRVITANTKGYSILGKKPAEVDGRLYCDAFECSYANLPGGCGKTVHCKTCAIRNTVTDTMLTATNHHRVPAYPDLHFVTGDRRIRFIISTYKIINSVILCIDEMNIIDK